MLGTVKPTRRELLSLALQRLDDRRKAQLQIVSKQLQTARQNRETLRAERYQASCEKLRLKLAPIIRAIDKLVLSHRERTGTDEELAQEEARLTIRDRVKIHVSNGGGKTIEFPHIYIDHPMPEPAKAEVEVGQRITELEKEFNSLNTPHTGNELLDLIRLLGPNADHALDQLTNLIADGIDAAIRDATGSQED